MSLDFFISWESHCSLEKEININRRLLMFPIKRKIRHFYIVVVQYRQEMYKKVCSTCKVLVLLNKPFAFLTFSFCRRRRCYSSLLYKGGVMGASRRNDFWVDKDCFSRPTVILDASRCAIPAKSAD